MSSFAQLASIQGTVKDAADGKALPYAQVYLKGESKGSATDVNGYYLIDKIKAGDYILMVKFMGYDTIHMPISFAPGEKISKNFTLIELGILLDGATVSGRQIINQNDPRTSVVTITRKDMEALPSIGGEADFAQYLQVVPGVVFTGDQGGQLYIRGGTPVQNKVMLDGMIIYNPFHSIGLFSVFDADIIQTADVYTGGFGAEHGGRISSIMDVKTRFGNPNRLSGKVSATTFGTKFLLEGPLVKYDENKGSLSYILSAKKSYIDRTSKVLYPYVNEGDGLPFNYTDLYGKLSYNSAKGTKLDVFGFNFNDQVTYQTINNYSWKSSGGGMRTLLVPESSPMVIEANLAFSNYEINLDDGSDNVRSSSVNGFNMGLAFNYFTGENNLSYGVEMKGFNTNYEFTNALNREISQAESTTEIAAFMVYKMQFGKLKKGDDVDNNISRWIFTPGLRMQYYASLSNTSWEPRIAAKFNATERFRLKMAAGMYSQNLISTASDRDVVNLFYGFISGPDNLQTEFNGKAVTHKLQKSNHYIFGGEFDVSNAIMINIEGYYKYFPQLTNLNRNKIFDDNTDYIDKPDVLKKDFILEEGESYGVDVSLEYRQFPFFVWAVYSLGYSTRYDGIVEYIPHYDRRHNVNFVATYTFGKDRQWEINGRWNFGTGFPFTPTAGNYELVGLGSGIGSDYTTTNGEVGIIYGSLNSNRLPSYHRLDVGVKRTFLLSEHSELQVNFSITNVYDRNNIFYIDRITLDRVDQLPFLPSLGASMKF